jgi:hypothetical protein
VSKGRTSTGRVKKGFRLTKGGAVVKATKKHRKHRKRR